MRHTTPNIALDRRRRHFRGLVSLCCKPGLPLPFKPARLPTTAHFTHSASLLPRSQQQVLAATFTSRTVTTNNNNCEERYFPARPMSCLSVYMSLCLSVYQNVGCLSDNVSFVSVIFSLSVCSVK